MYNINASNFLNPNNILNFSSATFYFLLTLYFFYESIVSIGIHITRQRFKYHFNQGFCTKSKVQRICSTGDWFQNYVRRSQIRIRRTVVQNFIVLKKLLVTMTMINLINLIHLYMVNNYTYTYSMTFSTSFINTYFIYATVSRSVKGR